MLRPLVWLSLLACALAWSPDTATETARAASTQQRPVSGSPAKPKKKADVPKAIDAGLLWLARHQAEDGSWNVRKLPLRCGPTKCFVPEDTHDDFDVGVTGLAVLAFLRAGHGPGGTKELVDPLTKTSIKTAEVVTRALDCLLKRQVATGEFARGSRSFVYDEAMAELAMAEAYALTQDEHWKDSAQRGANALVDAQRANPGGSGLWGWRYEPRGKVEAQFASDSDTSATGWCVVALATAQSAGLQVRKESFQGARDYVDTVTAKEGKVGYVDLATAGRKVTGQNDEFDYHIGTMSALGMLIRLESGTAATHEFFGLAAKQLLKDLPRVSADKLSVDYYYWFQGSAALNRLDEVQPKKPKPPKKVAEPWNQALIDAAVSLQDTNADRCSLGGWVISDRWSHRGGPVYATALMVLALEAGHPK